jgi:GNAT superfamily N-acetyltransferase
VSPPVNRQQLTLRAALPSDQAFLGEVLWMAHTWRETPHPRMPDRLPEPTCRYVDGFGRPGDHGVVASRGGALVGAAWWRHRTAADPGYGYLADDIPELTVAVRPAHRGSGVATAMLSWLTDEATAHGVSALSLSVESDNPAVDVYKRAGFVVVRGRDDAVTLRLDTGGSQAS